MYQLTNDPDVVLRTADNVFIPVGADGNADARDYATWLADGNSPDPVPSAPVVVPEVVSMRQARLALLDAGLLSAVTTAIAGMSSPAKERAQIDWEYATEVRRDNALLVALATSLSLDAGDLDALFTAAAEL